MTKIKIKGINKTHKIFLYTLSTCGWCNKTKNFLKDVTVEYEYLDVDTANSEERSEAYRTMKKIGLSPTFPAIIVNDKKFINGYKPDLIKEALGL